ncbi:DISARM system phospholipase D-like protein DrmC [Synechococcus sp. CS-1325]|uniref:DISARM system phospholipase D-like protein DrmC n=1 Tax=Synechococcus sp. CS-1325 TaxID=2847979 RepID=UPI000DB31095|nr:DISARM system phospholipase D-like protein DrmC [Synechococcus sp. CS-1325]MCT0199304.1 DISARM system phospholipase D-like protein DrmC [Synechococcus sp. CS-1325]PZU98510.1 MAG: phospholipase [Cyanobium sp.]
MSLTLPAQTLRNVAMALRQLSYTPVSWQSVLAGHSATIRGQVEPLLVEMVKEGAHPRLIALLLDRLADAQEALQAERDAWSFVWSGPDPLHATTADTFATVDQLISEAKSSLLIATYNIGLSSEFRDLFAKIAERLGQGQLKRVDLFFHPKQIEDRLGSAPLATISKWFNTEVWPWPAKPHAYVDQRLINGSAARCYQHAKVVIADAASPEAKALVTSANFSETAQRHNFEAGWLTKSVFRSQDINKQFTMAVEQGLFVPLNLAA